MASLAGLTAHYKVMLEKCENLALIDLFYDDNIVQVENSDYPVNGKIALLEQEKNNIEGVYWFTQKISNLVIDENSGWVMGEMQIVFNSKKLGLKKLDEAFVQQWKGDKIVYQRFYYKEFFDGNE